MQSVFRWPILESRGGALNFGLRAMCHQKDPTFFRSLSPKDPHFYQLSPNDPIFNKLLVTEVPWHIVTQRPFIFAFSSQTSDNFWQKIWIFRKFRQIWRNVEKFLAILALKAPIFLCISLKDPLFLCALSLKDPLFWSNLSRDRKTPTSEVLGGSRTSLSYVSPPPRTRILCHERVSLLKLNFFQLMLRYRFWGSVLKSIYR